VEEGQAEDRRGHFAIGYWLMDASLLGMEYGLLVIGERRKEKGTVARRCSRFFLHKNWGSTRDLMVKVAKSPINHL
jgi:hypothetical protein